MRQSISKNSTIIQLNRCEPFYKYRKTPLMIEFAKRLETAANSLFNDLQSINPLELNISEYNRRYLQNKLKNLESSLAVYADIVGSVLCRSVESLKDFVFIEYGGGTGFLSLLSKKMGVGTVVYNDIYDVSCKDAQEIAQILGCKAEYYVQGDIDSLVEFCRKYQIKGDGIASYDVIEHIYDIDDFCRKLHLISNEGATMMHASGANIFFYPDVKRVMKKQIEDETKDREEDWGHKKRDCLLSYSKERGKIIRDYCPGLNENKIERMVTHTRGLIRDDILKCVDRYIAYKEFPKLIEHPTNTCDPNTGNWAEHLMNPYYLQETLSLNGFEAKVLPRCWGNRHNSLENTIAKIVNRIIRISNMHIGLHICSYMAIYATYSGTFTDEVHRQHIYKCRRSPIWYFMVVIWEVFSRLHH